MTNSTGYRVIVIREEYELAVRPDGMGNFEAVDPADGDRHLFTITPAIAGLADDVLGEVLHLVERERQQSFTRGVKAGEAELARKARALFGCAADPAH